MIYYYLLAHKDELLVPLMRGATNKSLNIDRLAELKIPIMDENSTEGNSIRDLVRLKNEITTNRHIINDLEASLEAGVIALRELH